MSDKPESSSVIYFDNAATSYPKPQAVSQAVLNYIQQIGANPGRSGHRLSQEAGRIVFDTRKNLAELFGLKNPMRVILTANATEAINIALWGVLSTGDHIITSSMEHNSVIRPLNRMQKNGMIDLTIIRADDKGKLDYDDVRRAIKPQTRAVVLNHVSNVNGAKQPIEEISGLCRERELIFVVDAAQSAGIFPLEMAEFIDLIAIPGHKNLYGPTGTGALLIGDEFDFRKIKPLKFGGTGSFSDSIEQPDFLPDMLESGTLNAVGIAGLNAGIRFIRKMGLQKIQNHKAELQDYFLTRAIEYIPHIKLFTETTSPAAGVVSFRLRNESVSETAQKLSERFNIMSRHGLHCAPLAHQTLQTFPGGTLRFSFGIFNTKEEIDFAIQALREIVNG
jgi:cysteine desulfurase family protein